jgi:hypothetical protein
MCCTPHIAHPIAQSPEFSALAYLAWILDFCEKLGPERVINTEETTWLDVQRRRKTIPGKRAKRGRVTESVRL